MGILDWIVGKKSEEWYRNQLKKVMKEWSNYVNQASEFKQDTTPEQRKRLRMNPQVSRYEIEKYGDVVIGLINDMEKYNYQYKDILDWSYTHEFPSDYPTPNL